MGVFDAVIGFLTSVLESLTAGKAIDRGPQFVARVSLILFGLVVLFLAFGLFIALTGR